MTMTEHTSTASGPRLVDAVIYDFGGVFMASPFEAMRLVAEEKGMEYEVLLEVMFGSYHVDNDHPWHQVERGELPLDQARTMIRDLATEAGHDVDLYDMFRHLSGGEISEAMVACVRRVRATGAATAILTNNLPEAREFWRGLLPLDELFDVVVDSCEVGMRKPNPAIYRHTLDLLGGVAPERSAFLDDFPGNVEAARAVGMIGIHVEIDAEPAIRAVDELIGVAPRSETTS